MRGLNYRAYMSPETARQVREVFGRVYQNGRSELLVDYEVIRKDGTPRIHEMNVSLVLDPNGRATGFRGVVLRCTPAGRSPKTC
jgi:PAS domain S-box-containing protein